VTAVPRSVWETEAADSASIASHFDRPDFDPDAIYFVEFEVLHRAWPKVGRCRLTLSDPR
jgi:hypothetical protein